MVSADEIERFLADFNPAGKLNPEEVFLFGNPQSEVSGICVCWMATTEAVLHAARHQCNLIVCHEALTLRDYPLWKNWVQCETPWPADESRLRLLEEHQITVFRVHSTVDPTHIGPGLWDALDLPAPVFSGWVYSHHIVDPITAARLAHSMRVGLEVDHIRLTGDPTRTITNIGTCWGGGGLDRNMHIWIEHLLPRGIEALVVGETSDFTQRFCRECGITLLEGGHSATEDPGLRRLAQDLRQKFPELPVVHRQQEVPWTTL